MTRARRSGLDPGRAARLAVAATAALALAPAVPAAPTADGRVVYSNSTTTPQQRAYAAGTNTFAAGTATAAGAGQTWIVDRAAPARDEHVAGYVTTGGQLFVLRWNGTAWSNEWNVAVGGAGVNGRRFDIAYEGTSGRALVVYSNNSTGANELRYRIWDGAAWTAAANLDSARLTGTPNAVKLSARAAAGTNDIAATVADTNNVLTTLFWNGGAWANEPAAAHTANLMRSAAAGDNDCFDHAWETSGNDYFVVYSDNTPQQFHRQYTAGAGWAASTSWATARAAPLQMLAVADPGSDRILFAWNRGASANVYGRVWSGAAMQAIATAGASGIGTAVNRRTIAGGWLATGGTSAAVVMWMNNAGVNGRIDYAYSTNFTSFTGGTAAFGGTSPAEKRWMDAAADPRTTDTLMLAFSDSGSDLWAKRLVMTAAAPTFAWTDADGGAALTASLGSITTQNFSFAYDRIVPTTTVGNGTDPGNASLGPGGAATMLDAFSLQTNAGTDTVTAVTVALAAGTSAGLSLVEITSAAGGTVYGSAADPASDTVAIALGTSIPVTTALAEYRVRVTPKSHASMPAPPGSTYAVTGTVTAIASALGKVYADAGSATVTVDNQSPANPTAFSGAAGVGQVALGWTNPADADHAQVVVLRRAGAAVADSPAEGATHAVGDPAGASTVACAVAAPGASCVDGGLVNGTAYFYRAFARDSSGNYSAGGTAAGPYTPQVPGLAVGVASAAADSATQVTVTAPFTGDGNGNSSTAFERGSSAAGPWTAVAGCGAVGGASPRLCVDTGVAASTTYYYRVTFADPDGVTGTNPQVVGPVTTPAPPVNLVLANPTGGQPAAGNLTVGAGATVVGRFNLSASLGTLTADSVAVSNVATAPVAQPGTDISSLSLLDASGNVLGLSRWDGARGRYVFGNLAVTVGTTPATLSVAATAAYGAAAGNRFAMSIQPADVVGRAPAAATAGTTQTGNTFTIAAPGVPVGDATANSTRPMVSILNPGDGTAVSGTFRLQILVHSPTANGIADILAVAWSSNGAAPDCTAGTVSRNANYDGGPKGAVYETSVALAAQGSYALIACARNAGGTVNSTPVSVTLHAAGRGDGNLLVRDNASQLCADCHALPTHSSQSTSNTYGSWATTCRDCHQPHGTRNIFLAKEQVTPPAYRGYQSSKAVAFSAPSGDSGAPGFSAGVRTPTASFANSDGTGPCQVCHTQTRNPSSAAARWRSTGNADTHYTSAAGTQTCTDCHAHTGGFAAAESTGGANCSGCHKRTWDVVTGAAAGIATRHTLGNVPGTNASFADSGITWASPLAANAPAARSCVNMCHDDHVHNAPAGTSHDYDTYANATTGVTRAMTRGAGGLVTAGSPARTDFDPATSLGTCISCHQYPVESGASPAHPAVSGTAYNASAHDFVSNTVGATTYAWSYGLHDGSSYDRNCTKCHASRAEGTTPVASGTGLTAVHGTQDPSLLSGTTNPAGSAAGFVCYNCHGSAATPAAGAQGNRSGKDIQTQVAKARSHPAVADSVHDSVNELAGAAFGNALGGAARHSSCLDCHDPHQARAGTHAATTNLAGPPLEGAWGAQLSSNPAFWTAPAAGNFTKKTIVSGTDLEATLCFKCHSSYYGTLPASPSWSPNTWAETDTAREFNPNNTGNFAGTWASGETAGGFHPVLASAASNLGATSNVVAPWSRTSLMTCSDCHASNSTADPNGPHGSTAGFILRGPNTTWNASVTALANNAWMPAGTFCLNCHGNLDTNGRYPEHSRGDHSVPCFNCHAAIPHGGPRPGMLNAGAGAAAGVGGSIAGWDGVAPYWQGGASNRLYIASYPTNNTTAWAQSNCGCNGTGH